jgi:hypothetical protein
MAHTQLDVPARLYLFGATPIVEGTLADCVDHWKVNMSQLAQSICWVRVDAPQGPYWMTVRDLQKIASSGHL